MKLEDIDKSRVPQHVAIIMDGNGRWAQKQAHRRIFGHQHAMTAVHEAVEAAVNCGVKYLTLYTFSTENWNRPEDEVAALMALVLSALEEEIFMKNNVRLRVIGDFDRLPAVVQDKLNEVMEHTAANDAMTMTLALSYSSRWEITRAAKQIAAAVAEGKMRVDDICEDTLSAHMNTSYMPDPDLLIRTGGEVRVSNYLLWQIAYSELYFCDTYWPDFGEDNLLEAIADYQRRQRRFGKTEAQVEEMEQ